MNQHQGERAVQPLLSILLPAFNDAAGIRQALDSMGTRGKATDIEIIVSDDSIDLQCADEIRSVAAIWANAHYTRNTPPKGAAANWNHLLGRASGQYCLLMHHDEYFQNEGVLARAMTLLRTESALGGIVMPCRVRQAGDAARLHMPAWLVEHVSLRWPRYLLRRNLWGPPSVLILRRDLYEDYDTRLRWLVDVELYSRIVLRSHPRMLFMRGAGIVSMPAAYSITSTLQPQIASIHAAELALLADSAATPCVWFKRPGLGPCLVRGLESVAWYAFRTVQKTAHALHDLVQRGFRSIGRTGMD